MQGAARRLTLGTAGHIDHGKTALVRALTGVDTDRLPEEKRRGITIDLGFASLRLGDIELGIVDVPGHEAFVRNMLAGATGVDLLLLVIAADEGVMPQTREHLAIAHLLGIRRGVVALTKCDLVDAEWLELVREEVRETLAATGLDGCPVVDVSARTGAGLPELREALATAAAAVAPRDDDDLFRMPVDRVFTVHGTGTVVTGTVWSGTLSRGETVRAEPFGIDARVRGLQRHGAECDAIGAGARAAVALAGVDRQELARGATLLGGEGWRPAGILTVALSVLHDAPAVRRRQRVRVHLGTAEVLGRIGMLECDLEAGGEAIVQLRLEKPLIARAGDRIVLRSYSPVHTIAGGTVLEPVAPRRRRLTAATAALLDHLRLPDRRLAAALELCGPAGAERRHLPILTGLRRSDLDVMITGDAAFTEAGDRVLLSSYVADCRDAVLRHLAAFHADHPLEDGMERETLRKHATLRGKLKTEQRRSSKSRPTIGSEPDSAFDAALESLLVAGRITLGGSAIALAGHRPRPEDAHRPVIERLATLYAEAGLRPPDVTELPDDVREHPLLPALHRFLEREGTLVRLSPTRWADARVVLACITDLHAQLQQRPQLAVADFKSALNLSRKHLIPLLEYLDSVGATVRDGDTRTLAPVRSQSPSA